MRPFLADIFKILTISLFIASCNEPIPEVDISGMSELSGFQRFELDLFQNTDNPLSEADITMLKSNYGIFYKLFVEQIVAVGRADDSTTRYYLNHFVEDLQVQEIAQKTMSVYPEISGLNAEFSDAFNRYKVLFPERTVPNLCTFLSAFSYTIVVDDELLGIGLDMYLGSDNEYYGMLGIPVYKSHNMSKEFILTDAMKAWLSTEFELNSDNSDLLSHMIYHGKILYALDLLTPEKEDSVKIGFSARQMQWLKDNEKDMWFHFAENELFYSKESKEIQKYIGEAPFTPGFPEGSPGRAGRWIGWQIVRKYMKNTNPLDLKGLFEQGDSQKILQVSKYKPA